MKQVSNKTPAGKIPVPRRVLLVHPFGIGDVLFMTPVIRALKENGADRIDLLLGSRTRELFEHSPHVSNIYEWSKVKPDGWLGKIQYSLRLARMLFDISRNRYDAVLDFSLGRQYAFFEKYLWRIPLRAGFDYKKRGVFLNYAEKLEAAFSDKPVVEYYFDLLKVFGIDCGQKNLELSLSETDRQEARRILEQEEIDVRKPYLIVSPGGGESWGKDARFKRWPVEYFAGLIRIADRKYGFKTVPILAVGSQGEFETARKLQELLSPEFRVLNLCGKTTIRETGALIEKAKCVLANDGGIVHLSCALKTPVVGFYGPVDEKVYGPYGMGEKALAISYDGLACRPCYRKMRYRSDCGDVKCLTDLTPETAFQVIEKAGFFERLLQSENML